MTATQRIGIIGGNGWLGGAIAAAILDTGAIEPGHLSLSYRRNRPDRFEDAFWTADNQALVDRSDVVILSVRPEDWPAIPVNAEGRLLISVMAGIRIDQLSAVHATDRVVRALPNAAAEVGRSYTPWTTSPALTAEDRATARMIFGACGIEDEVSGEADIDYLTGLTGSGPAFPALLARAMMADAIAHGLPEATARRAVNMVLVGTGRLLERRDEDPAKTVKTFLDYRGTTAAAIETMRAGGFDRAVADGLRAAFKKSVSMGDAS